MERFFSNLEHDPKRRETLERLYILSGGGIHSHTISGQDTRSLAEVEKELKTRGFLLGVNLAHNEITQKISEYSRVHEFLLIHKPIDIDDKKIIINLGGKILDSKHYLPGLRQVITRKLYIKDVNDLKKCEEE